MRWYPDWSILWVILAVLLAMFVWVVWISPHVH